MSSMPQPEERATRPSLPLSILELAMVPDGWSTGSTLAAATRVAVEAERLGYHRFWVAEHHNFGGVASTCPPVLMAHLASATERIRIGSGGVMLPNHAPLAVAEQFAMLEALHPGRIDLGIGRAPGTDQVTASALRGGAANRSAEDFPRHLLDLMGLLGDRRTERGLWEQLSATPSAAGTPLVTLLGSSGFSAQLAAALGLPFAFAHHFDLGGTVEAVHVYRERFEPSPVLDDPLVIVTATAVVAETDERAEALAGPSRLVRFGIHRGRPLPFLDPRDAPRHPLFEAAVAAPSEAVVGRPERVVAGLDELARRTGADELMLHVPVHGLQDRLRSLELLAAAWGLGSVAPAVPSAVV